jgi:hypothetical protein
MRRPALILVAAAAAALTAATARPAIAAPPGAPPAGNPAVHPTVATVSRLTPLENLFTEYANHSTHSTWTGGDSAFTALLPFGRWVVSYSDTFLGPINPDGTRSADVPFIHNSIIVRSPTGSLRTLTGGTPENPSSLISPDDPQGWYWANATQVANGTFNEIYLQFHQTGTGVFDFQFTRNVLVRRSLLDLHLIDITQLPSDVPNLEWNPSLLRVGPFTYIYGIEDLGQTKYVHVARVLGDDLRGHWQYWTGSGWSASETDSARVSSDAGNNYSVIRIGGQYVLITQDQSTIFSNRIVALFSCSPTGPFTDPTLVYTVPEAGPFGSYGNPNVIYYGPHEHSELRAGNRIVLSYDVNSLDPTDLQANPSIYRPRWLSVSWTTP